MAQKNEENARIIQELEHSASLLRGEIERLKGECHSLQVVEADH